MLSSILLRSSLPTTLLSRSASTTGAAVCLQLGGPLVYDPSWPVSKPLPGEVRVKVAATGVNFAEILQTRGLYQEKKEPPFCPGNECAGEVSSVGEGSPFKIGDRVICLARGNGYAGSVVADSRACVKLPEAAKSMDLAEAAALLVNYGTAHLALTDRADLQKGETVLVTAAVSIFGF